ncbi:MAG: TraB/GumN family protein [Verrucomicrobia bacterium]|nr:TraB/GumN family protein [Verrucomicrobiota bacterium]
MNRPTVVTSLVAFFIAALNLAAADKPKTSGPSSVWVAEKDGHSIYLAGTIHLLREKDYPLPKVFEQAYKDSSKLIFELPPNSEGNGEIVLRMRKLGTYPEGAKLSDQLGADTLKRVQEWAEKNDYPMSAITRYRPWFLSLTIAAIEYQALGAESGRGLDTWFEKRATADGKPGAGLETVEYQLTLFASLPDKIQEQLLLQTLSEAETMKKDYEDMIAAWRSGEMDKLQEFLYRDADKFPELMQEFLVKRNLAWVAPLMSYLEKGERVMVLVGAGHLGGKTGLLELLKAKGCTIRQLEK